jgi:hypothetical protein
MAAEEWHRPSLRSNARYFLWGLCFVSEARLRASPMASTVANDTQRSVADATEKLERDGSDVHSGCAESAVNDSRHAPCAGTVFVVEDDAWGGLPEGTQTLSQTSAAIVGVSDHIVAIGGGDIARVEFDADWQTGQDDRVLSGGHGPCGGASARRPERSDGAHRCPRRARRLDG